MSPRRCRFLFLVSLISTHTNAYENIRPDAITQVNINPNKNGRPDGPAALGKVEIKVADNGNGIPNHSKEEIFQLFFAIKPIGQGTGLGLSLSYDIVKAHGGKLKVETPEGEWRDCCLIADPHRLK